MVLLGLAAGCARPPAPAPTYRADLSPRLAASCVACHQGDPARPDFTTLEGVRRQAGAMLAAVRSGAMPPGGIVRDGACGHFLGSQPFSLADADVLAAWVAAGMPEGTGPEPAADERAQPRADAVAEADLPLSPEADDDHRCFVVDLGAAAPRFLTGVSVAGGPVHHAMVFTLPGDGAVAAARSLEASGGGRGWRCPVAPQLAGARLAYAWVPGQATSGFPAGLGVALPTHAVVVQLHQHGPSDVAHTRVSLLLGAEVQHALQVTPAAVAGFSLPGAQPSVVLTRTVTVELPGQTRLRGVMPHMHSAGRAVSARRGEACLVDAARFDAEWQEVAFYDPPEALSGGASLTLRCEWDTQGRPAPTPWGESSDDEMCTVFLFTSAD